MPEETIEPKRPPDREEAAQPAPGGYPAGAPGDVAGYSGPRRLTRRMDDRMLAGVASGLGAYFNVDPVVFRVGFVALTLAGGTGVLIYLLCWVLLPPAFGPHVPPAAPGSPQHQGQAVMAAALRQGGWKTYLAIGAVLLALLLLFSPFTRPTVVFAVLLIALGVLLMVQDQPSGSTPPGQPGPGGGAPPGAPPPPPGAPAVYPPAGGDRTDQWQPTATGTAVPPAGQEPSVERAPSAAGTPPGTAGPAAARTWGPAPAWGQPSGWGQPAGVSPSAASRGGWGSSATAIREPAQRRPRSVAGWVTVALALLAGGVAGVLDNFGVVNMTPTRTLALMLTVVGAGLLVTSVWGRAGWLILVGVLLLPVVAATSVLNDLPVAGQTGDRVERPRTLAEVRPGYQLAAGNLTIDLSQVRFGSRPTAVDAKVSAGEIRVLVPAGQPVTVHATAGAGEIRSFGRRDSGFQVRSDVSSGRSERLGQLVLDLRVGVGSITVERGP
jgi:phage shock protein PspC (stress-responsive transcriptional regulator)